MEKIYYRVKHIPTGLYYKPGEYTNLSESGKLYDTKNTVMTFSKGCAHSKIFIKVLCGSKIYKKYENVLNSIFTKGEYSAWVVAPLSDFELETKIITL